MSLGTRFLVIALTSLLHMTNGGQLCGICSQVADPRDCDSVGECADDQVCYVRQYATLTGHTYYDIGCHSVHGCYGYTGKRSSDNDVPRLRAGNVQLCSSCCNDTALCNVVNGFCNSTVLDMTGQVLCYSCDYMHAPDQCDRVMACPKNQQCYVGQRQSGLSGSLLWTSRCGHGNADCQSLSIPINGVVGKKRSSQYCSRCCSGNFCNDQCSLTGNVQTTAIPTTTGATISKPVITFVSIPQAVTIGSYMHLKCRSTGYPTPTISWRFLSPTGDQPTNVFVRNEGADLYINGVTQANFGHYACRASNTAGDDTRYVDILENGNSQITEG
ncbi:limbic system-associated membrane protein-like [Argopecten irradians]|uniref:limbic system-associated membrane protein-like n=1 Tax=Argopecten irradians TaxID=31199 RepID=UPI00371160F2